MFSNSYLPDKIFEGGEFINGEGHVIHVDGHVGRGI